jgi:hypothetical protein
MPTGLMQSRLTALKMYLDSESLTVNGRQRAVEYQVRAILSALNQELEQERGAILDYLRLLGFDNLIAEHR